MIDCSNMSHEEYYRVNGTLSPARTEQVLDDLLQLDALETVKAYTTDAHSGYLEEDFLSGQIKSLRALAKSLRGPNRQALLDIISSMEDSILEGREARNMVWNV